MDSKLQALEEGLQIGSLDREEYTRACLRANAGYFLVWRGGTGDKVNSNFLEIEQPLFPENNNVPTTSPFYSLSQNKVLTVKQHCQVHALANNLNDLMELMQLQPSGILKLPEGNYRSFGTVLPYNHQEIEEYLNRKISGLSNRKRLFSVLSQPLYDTCYLPKTMAKEANFFQVPLGAADPVTHQLKGFRDTNNYQGGSLPYPLCFQLTGISIIVDPETPQVDAEHLISKAWVRLWLGLTDHCVSPSSLITLSTLKKDNSNPFIRLKHPDLFQPVHIFPHQAESFGEVDFCLIPQRNFRVEINFDEHVSFSQIIRLQTILHGYFYREVV